MKQQIRDEMEEKLSSLTPELIKIKSEQIINKLLDLEVVKQSQTICVYVSIKEEVFTHDLIKNLLAEKKVLVPFVEGTEMKCSQLHHFSQMTPGAFEILEPFNKEPFNGKVDLVIVPGLAFDRSGNRIGRGKGYYDKFLAEKELVKVALAFEQQIVEQIPAEAHDIAMDLIVTEKEVIKKSSIVKDNSFTNILDGKEVARKIKAELKEKINQLEQKPGLAVVLVGENPASKVYVNMKQIACEKVGIVSNKYNLSAEVSQEELLALIDQLNQNSQINGILVQLPLPNQIDEYKVIQAINPKKDVDGFHLSNVGKLSVGEGELIPCTPKGILRLLKEYQIPLLGKDVVVVGRSNIVGKPVASLFLHKQATVTICHSKTKNLAEKTKLADILVVAVGVPNLIKAEMVKPGVIVVDVGVNRVDDATRKKGYYLCGDVDFEKVKEKAAYITPVPGGIGPMTIAMLMENTLTAYQLQNNYQF